MVHIVHASWIVTSVASAASRDAHACGGGEDGENSKGSADDGEEEEEQQHQFACQLGARQAGECGDVCLLVR